MVVDKEWAPPMGNKYYANGSAQGLGLHTN